ncbi:hypothetical protein [Pedobacter sp. L105]|uniref:hypothetical protein n=1 Tax=Pedobacter sp. L105 TaxID=1641871 RepID=UPI00131CD652|nr:hypothetical protein [Pedobacter sp. L105]
MAKIIFTGWEVGMRGIPFIELLREKTNISLTLAKDIKEGIVNNEIIDLTVASDLIASEIVTEARKNGVICEIVIK